MRKTTRLRYLVTGPELAFLMEAHHGLSAKIVEEAGFEGVWASGLTISAAFGVRDNNELSWTQVTDHVAFMAEAVSVPILLDGDTGYGNFNSMRRLVRKLEQVGVAGVAIEDKVFPKTNSFLRPERQPLADLDEFCGKIMLDGVALRAIGDGVDPGHDHGTWIGLLHAGARGATWLREALAAARRADRLRSARLCDVLSAVLGAGHAIRVVYIRGGWVNVNNVTDLIDASAL